MKKCLPILLILVVAMVPRLFADDNLKKPNVSGQFYPGRPSELSRFMEDAESSANVPQTKKIGMIISPHAGYVYSGGVAAYGYKAASAFKYSTIVVIGPSHFHGFAGAAIWPKGKFETPLGQVDVDEAFARRLMTEDPQIQENAEVFSPEHSLEVQLPFLQKNFQDFKIVPVLMGYPDLEATRKLAQALNTVVGQRDDVLVVISTDLSHYHTYDRAVVMDQHAIEAMSTGNIDLIWNENQTRENMEMCGFVPVLVGLQYAKLRGLSAPKLLKYANSGDVTGDKSRVVGYSSLISYQPEPTVSQWGSKPDEAVTLTADQKKTLVKLARETLETFVKTGKTVDFVNKDPRLYHQEGAFVTLLKHGELRGCIGNIFGAKPLWETVRDMAIQAASEDPRFSPVKPDELKDIEVEVSVLSTPEKIADPSRIQLGVHGVIVSRGFNRGVFLPQVATETGWDLNRFMGELCSQKAGLPPDCWKDPKTTVEVFTAQVFGEKDAS